METKQALQFVKNALDAANQKGVFNLQDSATVFAALVAIDKALEPQPVPESEAEQKA